MPPRLIIFDDGLGQLGPVTDLRASFEVRTGMYTNAARIAAQRPKRLAGYWVPPHLQALISSRANAPVNSLPNEETLLCINGRWGLPDHDLRLAVGEALIEEPSGHVVAAHLRRADAEYFLSTRELHERAQATAIPQRVLYKYPWDIIALAKETIAHDLASIRILDAKVPADVAAIIGDHPVEVHRSAQVCRGAIFDAQHGAIVVHERAVIRPNAVLCGPCSIGPGSTVVDRALIKADTVIGPLCKVGGEVGSTIFQGCSNKAHDGHLGDSWIGKWVNFGAGTTNSNLLNTYGEISMRVEADGPRHRTGMTFLGAVVGDHAKFAINTRIMTGSAIGTGAMIACTLPPPTAVRRFAWLTDDGEMTYRLDRFLESMQAMMSRRNKQPSGPYVALLRDLHERSAQRAGRGD